MARTRSSQAGFAALEAVIAVVIIGIGFLITMRGTVLLTPMRAFITANQIERYRQFVVQYIDQNRAFPGDDKEAPTRWGRPPSIFVLKGATTSFAGDDRIQGLLSDEVNATGEQFNAWRDLRFSGMLEGERSLVGRSAMPENPFHGVYGFAEDNLGLDQVLCATQIPGEAAEAIDKKLDDGNISTGNLRGTSKWDPIGAKNHFTEPDTAPYNPDKTYIICLPFRP